MRLLFVGRAEERKGLPVLLSAFEALVEQVPSRLTVIGADSEEISRRVADPEVAARIDSIGKCLRRGALAAARRRRRPLRPLARR